MTTWKPCVPPTFPRVVNVTDVNGTVTQQTIYENRTDTAGCQNDSSTWSGDIQVKTVVDRVHHLGKYTGQSCTIKCAYGFSFQIDG